MAELTATFGAIGSGKSNILVARYLTHQMHKRPALVIKSAVDTKTGRMVGSRTGLQIDPDFLIPAEMPGEQLYDNLKKLARERWEKDCDLIGKDAWGFDKKPVTLGIPEILVDEVQFLSTSQVNTLRLASIELNIPVSCFGIATDFRAKPFLASQELFSKADRIGRAYGICRCGDPTVFNARSEDGGHSFVFEGDQVGMDGQNGLTYESMCARCYVDAGGKVLFPLR